MASYLVRKTELIQRLAPVPVEMEKIQEREKVKCEELSMKISKLLFAICVAISLEACNEKGKTDFGVNWYLDSGVKVYELNNGCTVRDSIGDAPMNEKMTVHDKDGRLLAIAGCASEWGCMVVVRYLYDEDGSVRGLLRSTAESEDDDETNHNEVLRHVFEKGEDDEVFEAFLFQKENGFIRKVFSPATNDSIKAPEWCHIEYAVKESGIFWVNDIQGGEIIPQFCVVPNEEKGDYAIDVYNGYRLQVRKGYSKGSLHSITVFGSDGYVSGYFPMDTDEYGLDDVNGFLFDTWRGGYANIE